MSNNEVSRHIFDRIASRHVEVDTYTANNVNENYFKIPGIFQEYFILKNNIPTQFFKKCSYNIPEIL